MTKQIPPGIFAQDKAMLVLMRTIAVLLILFATRMYSYLLFHTLVELLTISFAFTIFLLIWNSRTIIYNEYIKIVGIAYVICACMDLVHMMAFKGMNIFTGYDANLPTQVWIAARYLQALALVTAPFAIRRPLRFEVISACLALAGTLIALTIFNGIFPDCYREGIGLTAFKITSEYVIVALIILSIVLLRRIRNLFDDAIYKLLIASSLLFVCAELAFTAYIGVYDFANMIGHILKLASFYLVYRAIFVTAIRDPFSLVFKELKQKEGELVETNAAIEKKVLEQTMELRNLNNEQRIVLESAGVGISFVQDRRQKWANTTFGNIVGYSIEEMENISTEIFYPAHEDYVLFGKEAYTALKSSETFSKEIQMRHKDGTLFQARLTGKAVNPCDLGFGSIWILTDETARIEHENALREAKYAAEAANRAKSEFLSNMSHEIRTPMNGVIGMAHLLEMSTLTEEQQQYVSALKTSGNNLLSLINDILDLSKIEAGKVVLELTDFSLKQTISDIVLMQKTVIYNKKLTLDVNIPKDFPSVMAGDQLRLKQILLNLLGNAVKFTVKGGVTISAQVLERHETIALIQIAVQDTGIGISPENIDNIFKPFTQEETSTTRNFGGTGLGLTICSSLAELMGGSISVESKQGAGSCFKVTIPFSIVPKTSAENDANVMTPINWDGEQLRILLVEDNPINMEFAAVLLKKLGHDIATAENGKKCLAALKQSRFDLVLMDLQMPVMNGEEALKEIRLQEQGTSLHQPVIALTAYAMRGDKERLLKEGFDGYLSKPIVINDFATELKRVIGNFKLNSM